MFVFDELKCLSLNRIIQNVTCEVTSNQELGTVDKFSLEFDIADGYKIYDVFVSLLAVA